MWNMWCIKKLLKTIPYDNNDGRIKRFWQCSFRVHLTKQQLYNPWYIVKTFKNYITHWTYITHCTFLIPNCILRGECRHTYQTVYWGVNVAIHTKLYIEGWMPPYIPNYILRGECHHTYQTVYWGVNAKVL